MVRYAIVVGACENILGIQGCCTQNDDETLLSQWAVINAHCVATPLNRSQNLWSKKTKILLDVVQALHWCQSHDLIHVDLSPKNIKMTAGGICKLDLGLEQLLVMKKVTSDELRDRVIDFGVLFYWMCGGTIDEGAKIKRGGGQPDLGEIPQDFAEVIEYCWSITSASVIDSSFYLQLKDRILLATNNYFFPFTDAIWPSMSLETSLDRLLEDLGATPNLTRDIKRTFFGISECDLKQNHVIVPEQYINLLNWCGPDATDIVNDVTTLLSQPYFQGRMSSSDAFAFLNGKPQKTFIIRLNVGGSEPVDKYPYTISVMENSVTNYRVVLGSDKTFVQVTIKNHTRTISGYDGESVVSMLMKLILELRRVGLLGNPPKPSNVPTSGKLPTYHDQ
eukprot:TRINITY_DN303_c1_g1_i11.p1 TRINITY_DN303_c1_g1~~TRINITY_DN303_c1_g1_i11.p1  ORF type:complete len:392 (-),score=74.46 TRINITY_DN303_c1_g1_i11:131-1306(-)